MKPALLLSTLAFSAYFIGSISQASERPLTRNEVQTAFFEQIYSHCGKAYRGSIVKGEQPNDPFSGKMLVMHVRECSENQIKIPFHVGDDHSRTWVITNIEPGLRLKHDHRHQDGSEDKVTQYGGDTQDLGTTERQSFPVDEASIQNFTENGLTQSVTNVWHMMITPSTFSYRLTREDRDFQVDFDLTKPVALPPAPWGHK